MGKRGRGTRKKKFQPLQQWLALHPPDPAPLGWIDLPAELTENILQRLGPIEILETAQNVCATWRTVCQDPAMWRFVDMAYPSNDRLFRRFHRTCRRAVDLSNGELVAINIEHFGDDRLLRYVSERSGHLKRLRIENCHRVRNYGVIYAVKKLPELEELHLGSMTHRIFSEDIRTFGVCCPLLKSFTLTGRVYNFRCIDNRAMAIARNMPNLRHLGLLGFELSNEGVKAILGGCPRLESIDLRDCFNVDLDKQLCFESIHDLRRLFDHSTANKYDQWDDENGYLDDCSSNYINTDHCFPNSDDEYSNIDDDDGVDDDFGYHYDAGQIEGDCRDATFRWMEEIKPFS